MLEEMRLIDYKVRILAPGGHRGRDAGDDRERRWRRARWATVGVSANVIDASYAALHDAIT